MARKHTFIISLAVLSLVAFAAGSALAATGTAPATVTIVEPLVLVKTVDMAFGTIAPPSSGTQDFVLSTAGAVDDSASDGNYFSGAAAGQFTIDGTSGQTVTVTPTVSVNFDGTGVSLTAVSDDRSGSLVLSGSPDAINLGGTMNVDTAASIGLHTATVQLEVLYP